MRAAPKHGKHHEDKKEQGWAWYTGCRDERELGSTSMEKILGLSIASRRDKIEHAGRTSCMTRTILANQDNDKLDKHIPEKEELRTFHRPAAVV